jgi:hypothetical protein
MNIQLLNSEDMFTYILSPTTHDNDLEYFKMIENIENDIDSIYIAPLNFNVGNPLYSWVNTRYISLVKIFLTNNVLDMCKF